MDCEWHFAKLDNIDQKVFFLSIHIKFTKFLEDLSTNKRDSLRNHWKSCQTWSKIREWYLLIFNKLNLSSEFLHIRVLLSIYSWNWNSPLSWKLNHFVCHVLYSKAKSNEFVRKNATFGNRDFIFHVIFSIQ